MAANPNQQEFNLREYWQILVRRRWLIYTSVLVATVAAVVASFIATPTYRATCTVSIERSGVRLLKQDLASSEPSWLDYQNFYNTQYRIIESDRVLKEAVEILNLAMRGMPGEKSKVGATLSEFRSDLLAQGGGEEQELREYIKFLRGGLSVDPVRDSHLVEISFVSPDKEFAAEAANAVAGA